MGQSIGEPSRGAAGSCQFAVRLGLTHAGEGIDDRDERDGFGHSEQTQPHRFGMSDQGRRNPLPGQIGAETDAQCVHSYALEPRDVVSDGLGAEVLTDADGQQDLAAGQPFVDLRQLGGMDDRHLLIPGRRRIHDDVEGEFAARPELSQSDHGTDSIRNGHSDDQFLHDGYRCSLHHVLG